MAKLMFLFACSVLCVAFAQEMSVPSETTMSSENHSENQHEPSPNPAQPSAIQHETAGNHSLGAAEQAVGTQTQTSVAASEASVPSGKKGEIAGSVPLDPSAQAATSTTTETPKGGSATVGANTVLFLLGAAVLLKL